MHRQFAAIAPRLFDSQGSIVGPQGLEKMVFYMDERYGESALLIGSTVLSIASDLWQFDHTPSPPFDFE
jgi:hypothetical protein